MRSCAGRFAVNILLVVAAVVLTLLALEIGIRIFRPQSGFAVTVNTWDRELGTRHIHGARGFVRNPDYEIDLVINSKGLRDREFPYEKPEDTRRIVVLGGSFTCGYGVQARETFSKVLERLLNSGESDARWEVINMGVGSTGTAHQYTLFVTEGYKYDPDFVLLCFSQDNDYWDNITCGLYTLENGALVKHDAPRTSARAAQQIAKYIPGYNSLFARSHLLNLIKARTARFHFRQLAERSVLPDSVSMIEEKEEEITRALVLALQDACEDIGCRLVMTGVPDATRGYVYHDETHELIAFARFHGIPFVSLSRPLGEAAERGVPIRFENDLHWKPNGHEIAARVLRGYFDSGQEIKRGL